MTGTWKLPLFLLFSIFTSEAFTVPSLDFRPVLALAHKSLNDEVGGESLGGELSEERKANLFQFLLRDLEVEGVPLLGCDADQVHIFQAAVWTIISELSNSDLGEKACLVVEDIPIDALHAFVDDFAALKAQMLERECLTELERISLSLVGRGVGPALLIETKNRTIDEVERYRGINEASRQVDEQRFTSAMRAFVDRMVVGLGLCPHTRSNTLAPSGLEGVPPGAIAYRSGRSSDICDILATFWTCVCEIISSPEDQLSATVLCIPPLAGSPPTEEIPDRFAVVSEVLSRSLFLYRGEEVLDLLYMHPRYDRDLVHPSDRASYGHLPPTRWLRPMLRLNGNEKEADSLSDEDLKLQNYQRRSPLQAVIIKRVSQVNAGTPNGLLDLDDGTCEKARGIQAAKNLLELVAQGEKALQEALDSEIAIAMTS